VREHPAMGTDRNRKEVDRGRNVGPSARSGRDESILREVRGLLSADERLSKRFRRLERMESVARVWINGRALGTQPPHEHLSDSYD
jgi:hypothetical protein